jgi:hypothetical protein
LLNDPKEQEITKLVLPFARNPKQPMENAIKSKVFSHEHLVTSGTKPLGTIELSWRHHRCREEEPPPPFRLTGRKEIRWPPFN